MASIVIAGDVSGTCTLQAANAAGNTVLNLPTTSGTLVSSGSIPAAGSNTQVQYNSSGSFAGSSNFVFDGTNVGIGTSSPATRLHVVGSALFGGNDPYNVVLVNNNSATGGGSFTVQQNGSSRGTLTVSGAWLGDTSSDLAIGAIGSNIRFYTNNVATERMRIDSAGNVGINGIPTDTGFDTTDTRLYVVSPNSDFGAAITAIGDSFGRTIRFANQAKTTQGLLDANSTGVAIGSNSNHPMLFFTNGSERMRITSGGSLCINNTTSPGGQPLFVKALPGVGGAGFQPQANGSGAIDWYNGTGGYVASVVINAGSVSYNTTSDYRLKENIAPMTGALAKVQALKPVTYTWKNTGEHADGFIAHELAEVCPNAVTGEKDAVDAEGNPKYQGVDTSYLIATLTAAIQELNIKVEEQAAEIAALKGAN